MYYYYDPTYLLVLIGAVLVLLASTKVNMTYSKYSKVKSASGMTGRDVALQLLRDAGITDVTVQRVSGKLTDHYDPRTKTVRLSDSVYNSSSVAAIGVAAHECGHAIQDANGYVPLRLRGALVPVANLGSNLAWPIIILGIILSFNSVLIHVGIIMFSLAVAFQLVTLPVEFNASGRALRQLREYGILDSSELRGSEKVLRAAALTYVAAAASSILQLLRLLLLFGRRDD
ncbi:MAG: zinc metallopeptidase [Lachnospiraceae bacterium]